MFHLAAKYNITGSQIGLGGSQSLSGGLGQITSKLVFAAGALSVIFIIVGGLQMAASNGDPKRFAMGRQSLLYAVIGLILSLGAYAVVLFLAGQIGK